MKAHGLSQISHGLSDGTLFAGKDVCVKPSLALRAHVCKVGFFFFFVERK